MKTIFRYANLGLLVAAMIAMGALAVLAQTPAPVDPCADADGQSSANDNIINLFKDKTIPGRKAYVNAAKGFLEKYGSCPSAKDLSDYLKPRIPVQEETIRKMEEQAAKDALAKRFDGALDAKNWDEVMAAGKEILTKYPDEFRTVEIVLAALGGEEAFKGNFKYADDGVRFAKQSIADLEGGKSFMIGKDVRYGLAKKDVYNFAYATKDDAIGWMNLYIGYIMQVSKKDKVGAAPFLFKATQSTASDASKNATSFDLIGGYYIDALNKVYDEIKVLSEAQKDTDPEDVAKQKVDAIKTKVAMANGTAERAMDAYARGANLAKDAGIKARLRKTLEAIYQRRFDKTEGVDAWIASSTTKPFPNPTSPITPISDPEPVKTDGGTSVAGAGTGTGNGTGAVKPAGTGVGTGTGNGAATKPATTTTTTTKPATTTTPKAPIKPGSKPVSTTKKPIKKKAA